MVRDSICSNCCDISFRPKEFPIALKKIGTYIGKLKNTLSNFQKEVSSVTDEMNFDEEVVTKDIQIKKDTKKDG